MVVLSFEQIKELITMVAERRLESFELERAGMRLRIVGRSSSPATGEPIPLGAPTTAPTPARVASEAEPLPAAERSDPHADAHVLKSPIVGTFYAAPSPDADAFVQVGDRVRKGQVVCIVEAMKLMNEIESDADGVIAHVYPQNAQPVEYGEPLFAIRIA
ncbi:MAG TPA: acetyl-CoA carboxylase biotin carboxyl carrier protein [Thermoanaerobaculia bacterium]|nr:acetyl-CoA carboxylase biotin carboxyl carrier protein [Thermoanaerobaculia bacterium]